MGIIKEIIFWLFIFIVGSLIVSFLIYPETFTIFKERFNQIKINKVNLETKNIEIETIKLIPSNMSEYGFFREAYKSCATLEAMGESEGISNIKQKVCREACGLRDMDYSNYDCEKNLLVCYCKE